MAESRLDEDDLGIGAIPIRGFDPIADGVHDGRDRPPRLRELVAERDAGHPRSGGRRGLES